MYFSDEEDIQSSAFDIGEKNNHLHLHQSNGADNNFGSVIGGDPGDMMQEFEPIRRMEEVQVRDICASPRVDDTPSLRGEPHPFEVVVLKHEKHDVIQFHNDNKQREKQLNSEKIEYAADPFPYSDWTTPANAAANDRNFQEMQHCKQWMMAKPIEQYSEGRTKGMVEALEQLFPQRSNRKAKNKSHSCHGQPEEEPTFTENMCTPMFDTSWMGPPKTIKISVHKKSEDQPYIKEVNAKPFFIALGIPKEDSYNAERVKLLEKHHVVVSKLSPKDRRELFMELCKKDKDARTQQKGAQKLSPEGVNTFRAQLECVDSSVFEQGSEVQTSGGLTTTQNMAGDIQYMPTTNEGMAIEVGINFMADGFGITVERPPFLVEKDGDCLLNSVAIDADINRNPQENAQHGTDNRQIIFTEVIKKVNEMPSEKVQLLQAAAGACSKAELIKRLWDYTQNGRWADDMGDLMPQMISSFTHTPLFVIAVDPERNQTMGHFFRPSEFFEEPEHNSVPIVVVRQHNHYNRLMVPRESQNALSALYREAERGQTYKMPYSRSAQLVSEGPSQQVPTMNKTSQAPRSVVTQPRSDGAAPKRDPVRVKRPNLPPKTGGKEKEASNEIVNNFQGISTSGPKWRKAMKQSLLGANPNYELKTGVNISCTKPKPADMLCSVHSTVTALLNLQSIKYSASLKQGPVGNALTKFTESSVESEKTALIDILADECGSNEQMGRCGQDAGVVMRTMLENLESEGEPGTNIFSQNLEVFSTCISCGGIRRCVRTQVMSVKYNKNIAETKKVCKHGKKCEDGEVYKTKLLNCPDTLIQVVGSRGGSVTYKQKENVPLEIRTTSEEAKYNLKFCIVHLGKSPLAGHFVTLLSNPLCREQCAIIDNGDVKWISQQQFEEFASQAYIIGYELDDPKSIPQQSAGEVLTKMGQAMKKMIRKEHALESQSFLGKLSENIAACHYTIENSFTPPDARKKLIKMLKQRTYGKKLFPLLKEEEEANARARILFKEIQDFKPKKWGLIKKIRSFFGLYDDANSREIQRIEMLCTRGNIKEPVPKSKVLGTGVEPRRNKNETFRQNADFTHELDDDGKAIFKCRHCGSLGCKQDLIMHEKKGRCSVLKNIDKHYKITPRNIARGIWWNENIRLRVIRRHDRGNKTKILLEDRKGDMLSCVFQTSSPTDLDDTRNVGVETPEGKAWNGIGYCLNETMLTAIRETVKFKEPDQSTNHFPVWSLVGQVFSIEDSRENETGVNLNVEAHPAKNPANRKLQKEFELILVASENGGQETLKLVVRQTGRQDEELTYFKQLNYSEEEPVANDRILQSLNNCGVQLYVTKAQLAEVKQFSGKEYKTNNMLKLINPGDYICWGNVATQLLLHTSPNIGRDLFRTMEQASELSGGRDLPRMILEIITKAGAQQSLNNLRYLLVPERHGKPGAALDFFEKLVEKLKIQSPTAIDGYAIEHELSEIASQCTTTKGCNGTMPSSTKIRKRDLLLLYHNRRLDGLSVQSSINRFMKELEKPFSRMCTEGHSSMVKKDVSCTKMPEVFLVNALDAFLDQQSSLQVQLAGVQYRATGIWHHIPGTVGHHFCSLYDEKKNQWFKIDDFHNERDWKKAYYFDRKESAFKCGQHKLFDNLGVVFYKRFEKEDIIDEPESDAEDIRSNWHTRTKSGQQVFLSRNMQNECYAIQAVAFLLSNPYMHHLLRTWPQDDCNQLENYLKTVCHYSPTTIAPNTLVLRELLPQVQNFRSNEQQDAMEVLTVLLQNIRIKNMVNAEGDVVLPAPVSTDVLGFTYVTNTRCMIPGCTRNSEGRSRELAFSIEVSGSSINDCLKLQFQLPQNIFPDKCDTCESEYARYERTQHVVDLKKCIIIQLKRFGEHGKITTPVTADEILQEGPFRGYELTGAILHLGDTTKSGHYTHILRDIEDHSWIETNNHEAKSLAEDIAKTRIRNMGYIFFYASPNGYPEPLKSIRKAHMEPTMGPRMRKEPKQKKSFFTQTSNFRTTDDPIKINLPKMPRTSKFKTIQIYTPSEQDMSKKIEANIGKKTYDRIIDHQDPLYDVLKTRFGHDDFLCIEQLTATRQLIEGNNDILVLFPTGVTFIFSSFLLQPVI